MRWEVQAPQSFLVYTGARSKETKSLYEKCRSRFALLICDSGAGWSRQVDNFKALEAYFATPLFKIRGRMGEGRKTKKDPLASLESAKDFRQRPTLNAQHPTSEVRHVCSVIRGLTDALLIFEPVDDQLGAVLI